MGITATTGFFDGVHRGHRHVIDAVLSEAGRSGSESAVVTFWPHPRAVLQQDAADFRLLTTLEEKKRLLRSYGIDRVFVEEFTHGFSRLSARDFVKDILVGKYGISHLVIGYDHRFGRKDGSDDSPVECICAEFGVQCTRVGSFSEGNLTFSSTKIRNYLKAGNIVEANDMLGYRYSLDGVVVSGMKNGRLMGFPTANLDLCDPRKMIPADGVYLVAARIGQSVYRGICNIGGRPTVDDRPDRTIETHLLDFSEDIYGLEMKISFISRIRETVRFSSVDELARQLESDRNIAAGADPALFGMTLE